MSWCFCVKLFNAHHKKLAYRVFKRQNKRGSYDSPESHFYREDREGLLEITDSKEKERITSYRKKHCNYLPDGTTCESGYTSLEFDASSAVCINPSLVEKRTPGGGSTATIVARLSDGPKLPVSCIAVVEQVVAMQNEVTDFVSDYKPASKKRVMYQILLQMVPSVTDLPAFKTRVRAALKRFDECLTDENIAIRFYRKAKRMSLDISTQTADIQKLIKGIKSIRECTIVNPAFPGIGLNEGICLVKSDASNPIHALVNVADTKDKKVFLERDAGLTSGLHTPFFQDSNWTFNPYRSLEELKAKTGYSDKAFAVKLYLKP